MNTMTQIWPKCFSDSLMFTWLWRPVFLSYTAQSKVVDNKWGFVVTINMIRYIYLLSPRGNSSWAQRCCIHYSVIIFLQKSISLLKNTDFWWFGVGLLLHVHWSEIFSNISSQRRASPAENLELCCSMQYTQSLSPKQLRRVDKWPFFMWNEINRE